MAKPLRVLIVEDSEDDTLLLLHDLRKAGYEPTFQRVDTASAMDNALFKQEWDIVISDHNMPQFNSTAALAVLKQSQQDLPFIILSGSVGEDIAVKMMKTGAHDYIMKNNRSRLLPAIERELKEASGRKSRQKLEQQFLHAQKLEAIGRLAGGVAHDFNNLLFVILGYSDILLTALPPGDPNRNDVDEIKKTALRAASLTQQLLAFSRRQVLQPQVLDLNSVVTNLERMLHRLIGDDIELSLKLDPTLGAIEADPGQIEQVLMNLAVNARDAMPGGGTLTLETHGVHLQDGLFADPTAADNKGPHAMLVVRDTGVGMDKLTQAQIFEPFFTTKETGKGTGLGLSTVYGIVKQSGGFIAIESNLGKGTAFKIYLPIVNETAAPPEPPVKVESRHQPGTILVVEDSGEVRHLLQHFLNADVHQVMVAADGNEAIRIATEHKGPLDLVIADIALPGINGVELCKQLKSIRPDIKTLYISGNTDMTILSEAGPEAEKNFLIKPFSSETLLEKVQRVLAGEKTR